MHTFFDTLLHQVQTERMLTMRGVSLDQISLAAAGILPIEYPYPVHDTATHTIVPDGEPHPDADSTAYVQDFMVVELPLGEARQNMKKRVTARRWQAEIGGVDEPGYGRILTGLDDQNRIASALIGIIATGDAGRPITEVDFKGADGWAKISPQQLNDVAAIVSAHVQACFSRERELHEHIDAADSLAALAAIDMNAGWPESRTAVGA